MKKHTVAKMVAAGAMSAAMFFAAGQTDTAAAAEVRDPGSVTAPTEQVERMTVNTDDVLSEEEYSRRIRREKSRRMLRGFSDSAISAGVLLLSVAAKTVMKLLGSVIARLFGASVTGLAGFIGDVIINFIIIAALFSLAFKLMFPGRSLKEMWTFKNVLIMLGASVAIELVRYLLAVFSSKAYFVSEMLSCIMTLGIIGYAYYKVFRLEGAAASALKRALSTRAGIFTALGLGFGSVFAVFVKSFFAGLRRFAAFSQLTFVFIIALMVVICGVRLFRPMKNIMLITEHKVI